MRILLTVLLIMLSGCAAQFDKYDPVTTPPVSFNQEVISRYLLTQYKNVPNEQARVIYYQDNKYLKDEIIATGSSNGVSANGLNIVINCTILKCNQVILAHNHPNQYFARASGTDLDNAYKFRGMMKQANITPFYVILGDADANWIN